jgi:BCD family chlorophyll transporter-like MFS transporter
VGIAAFSAVIFAEPLQSPNLFRVGVTLIGFGAGLFSVATLTAAMALESHGLHGLALGAWGAVQATCTGVATFAGGAVRDAVSSLAEQGVLGEGLVNAATGYSFVYHVEMYLLFATLIAIGPLVRASARPVQAVAPGKFGLADLPG